MTYAEDYRRLHGFHGRRHAGARRSHRGFDLLLGRKTYEIFAGYWPYYDEGGSDGGIAKRFNEFKLRAACVQVASSRVASTGVLIGHYERDGEVKIRDGALDSPSKREIARQERMKREG